MKTAVITGGGQGIGRCLVQHFLGEGWRVMAFDLDAEALAELKAAQADDRFLGATCDVSKEGDVARAFQRLEKWSGGELDLLVNNAGLADPEVGPLEKLDLKTWRAFIDSHLTGAFLCSRAAIPLLRERKGSIVNIASTRAFQSEPETEPYAAAKGGLVALTHAMAVSLGPDIRVNCVAPGWIEVGPWKKEADRETPRHKPADRKQHPVGRVGEPQDIAAAVAFLASEGAGFITGHTLVADGGMSKKMIYA